jgi:hypothetical protein
MAAGRHFYAKPWTCLPATRLIPVTEIDPTPGSATNAVHRTPDLFFDKIMLS